MQPRRGLDALLDAIENLQGAAVPASVLESEILPARIVGYKASDLDTLIAAGEVVWAGVEGIGERDGRVALYLAEKAGVLQGRGKREEGRASETTPTSEREGRIVEYLKVHGASFFQPLHDGTGGGFPGETLEAVWNLVWRGEITNDGLNALRAYCERPAAAKKASKRDHQQGPGFRSRRTTPPTAQGRWSLIGDGAGRDTEWSHAVALQLLARYGVVFRETAHAEGLVGGFSAVYDVLKAMEERAGEVRRGYFASGSGARCSLLVPAAVDLLRTLRVKRDGDKSEMLMLAATDPANPYAGALMHVGLMRGLR